MPVKDKISRIIIIILSGLTALPTGLQIGYVGSQGGISFPFIYLTLAMSFFLALLFQTALHEAGHLVCGLLTGYRFISYRVGSFIIYKKDGRLKTGRYAIPGTLGQCLMGAPDDPDNRAFFLYNAGGVIFNLISGVICYLLSVFIRQPFIAVFLLTNGLYALMMFFSNAIPTTAGGVANDGKNISELAKHPQAIPAFQAMLKINELLYQGWRPKDIPAEQIDLNEDLLHTGSIGFSNLLQQYSKLLDEHDFVQARAVLEKIKSGDYPILGFQKDLLQIEEKYLDLLDHCHSDFTDKKMLAYLKKNQNSLTVIRYGYAKALAANDMTQAKELEKRFAAVAALHPYQGEIQSEKELMEIAKERLTVELADEEVG